MKKFLSNYFNFDEKNTTLKTEIIGGITTFLTMAYALFLIPSVLSETGMNQQSVFVATGLAAVIGTLIMGIYAKFPMVLAPGVGLNAFFAYSVCLGMNIPWQTAIAGVMASGIIFLIISITGLREIIIKAIPQNLKFAVSAGIGLFIAFVGFKNAGIIVKSDATFVQLGNLTDPNVLLAVFGILVISILMVRGKNTAIFIGMALTIVVGMIFGIIPVPSKVISMVPSMAPTFGVSIANIKNVFTPQMMLVVFTFLFMDFFDTAGTLVAVGSKAGLLRKDGSVENGSKALLADSVATCIGAVFGTTNTTSYVESLSGIACGFLTYVILNVFKGNYKKIHPVMYALAALFIVYFMI